MSGHSASPLSISFTTLTSSTPSARAITPLTSFSFSSHNFPKTNLSFNYTTASTALCRPGLPCRLSSGSGGPTSGEIERKDAFFLGRAFVEVVNERVESAVGGFQAEVVARATKAEEQAAREAQEIVPKASTGNGSDANICLLILLFFFFFL